MAKRNNFELMIGNEKYTIEQRATEGEIIVYGLAGTILVCYFIPTYIPLALAWSGLLGSLYGIASIIKNK